MMLGPIETGQEGGLRDGIVLDPSCRASLPRAPRNVLRTGILTGGVLVQQDVGGKVGPLLDSPTVTTTGSVMG